MFREVWKSFSEWKADVFQRWWDMLNIPIAAIPLIWGIVQIVSWSRKATPSLPTSYIFLLVGGTILFVIVSFWAFHQMRVQRDKLVAAPLSDSEIKLMEWRKDYRKSQSAEVSQIPATLKVIWALVDKVTLEKKRKRPSEEKLINVVADSLQIDKDDSVINTSHYSTVDKIRKATKLLKAKMGLKKPNAEIEARLRKRLSETMDDHGIGLLLKKNHEYTTLTEQLKNEGEPISKTMVHHKIDSFLENLSAFYSIKLFVQYGRVTEKMYLFPREMREALKHLEDTIERVMRTLFTQVKEALEDYSIGKEFKEK